MTAKEKALEQVRNENGINTEGKTFRLNKKIKTESDLGEAIAWAIVERVEEQDKDLGQLVKDYLYYNTNDEMVGRYGLRVLDGIYMTDEGLVVEE